MAEGRGRLEWAQTSQVLCMLQNTHRDPKSTAAKPEDFNPYASAAKAAEKPDAKTSMKALGSFLKPRLHRGNK
jgi:hypothetical protein